MEDGVAAKWRNSIRLGCATEYKFTCTPIIGKRFGTNILGRLANFVSNQQNIFILLGVGMVPRWVRDFPFLKRKRASEDAISSNSSYLLHCQFVTLADLNKSDHSYAFNDNNNIWCNRGHYRLRFILLYITAGQWKFCVLHKQYTIDSLIDNLFTTSLSLINHANNDFQTQNCWLPKISLEQNIRLKRHKALIAILT